MESIKSPLIYIGGKYHLAKNIIGFFPKHTIYVEPFGGAAHVLCQKPRSMSVTEVYNDTNEEMINLFKVLLNPETAEELLEIYDLTPYSRQLFIEIRDGIYNLPIKNNMVKKAWETLVIMKQCFSGNFTNKKPSFGFDKHKHNKNASHVLFTGRLRNLIDRLRSIQIEKLDFRDCIKKYDSHETLFYCDPPYVDKEDYYTGVFNKKDHIDLAGLLNNIQGKVIVSYYPFEGFEGLYPQEKWNYKYFNIAKYSSITNKTNPKKPRAKELLLIKKQ